MDAKDNVSLIIGRFTPLTVFHCEVIDSMENTRVIATTRTRGKNNPIEIEQKIIWLRERYPDCTVVECTSAFDALVQLGKLIPQCNVTVHCGNDRSSDYQRLSRYNEETGVELTNVVTHQRLHEEHSATTARRCAEVGQYQRFKMIIGYQNEDTIRAAYDTIRAHSQPNWRLSK